MKTIIEIGILGAMVALVVYLARRAGINANSINPASSNNLAYRGVNGIIRAVTGDPNQTAGGLVHDTMNPRAGLGSNEYSPGNGLIVTLTGVQDQAGFGVADIEDAETGAAMNASWQSTAGGAVTGRQVVRGF